MVAYFCLVMPGGRIALCQPVIARRRRCTGLSRRCITRASRMTAVGDFRDSSMDENDDTPESNRLTGLRRAGVCFQWRSVMTESARRVRGPSVCDWLPDQVWRGVGRKYLEGLD